MKIINRLIHLNRHLNRLSQEAPISNARLETLRLIKEKNPITLKQLCEIQKVSMPTMSKLVDELQNEGLVFRAQSKDDARQRWIMPTQKGLQKYQSNQKQLEAFWESQLGQLSPEMRLKMQQVLEHLVTKFETHKSN